MEAKDKAIELFEKMYNKIQPDELGKDQESAKQCALIAVDEIINTLNRDIRDIDVRGNILLDLIEYWQEVKQEIINL